MPKEETFTYEEYLQKYGRKPVEKSIDYDLDGKPIPNKADDVDDAKAGNFVEAGLEEEFHEAMHKLVDDFFDEITKILLTTKKSKV